MERGHEFVFFLDRKQEKVIGKKHRADAMYEIQYHLRIATSNRFLTNTDVRVYFGDKKAYYRGTEILDPAEYDELIAEVLTSTAQYLRATYKRAGRQGEPIPDNFEPSQELSDPVDAEA